MMKCQSFLEILMNHFPTLTLKILNVFYVKEEVFSCSSAEDGELDIPIPKKQKGKKKSKPVLKQQPVMKDRVPMPMGKMTGASKAKKNYKRTLHLPCMWIRLYE